MIKEEILAEMPEYWRECIEKYNRDGKCGSVMYSTVSFIPFFCKLLAAIEPEDEAVRLVKTPLKDIKPEEPVKPPVDVMEANWLRKQSDLIEKEAATWPEWKKQAVEVERLNKEKEKAVANQDFEKAASLRDQADNLRKKKTTIPNPFHPEINLQIESGTIKAKTKLLPPDWSEGYYRPTGDV